MMHHDRIVQRSLAKKVACSMTVDFYPSPRSDNGLFVNSDLPRLLKRPGSTLFPQVLNKSTHSKSHSVSHPHIRSTANQQALGPSPFIDQESSSSFTPSFSVYKAPSTPPRRHRYSSSLSHTPLAHSSSVSSFDVNPELSSRLVLTLPSPVSPRTPTRSQRRVL
jgi:hypothetical protein